MQRLYLNVNKCDFNGGSGKKNGGGNDEAEWNVMCARRMQLRKYKHIFYLFRYCNNIMCITLLVSVYLAAYKKCSFQ